MNGKFWLILCMALSVGLGGGCKKAPSKQQQVRQQESRPAVVPRASLHDAASTGNVAWMKVLLAQGSDPNERSAEGHTPLCVAIRAGNARSVAFLLQNGADRNEREGDGGEPLWIAYAGRMTPEIIKFMLPGDATAEQVYKALNLAIAYNPDERAVDLLLEKAQTFPDFASRCFWPAALESDNQTVVDSLLIRNIIPVNGCPNTQGDPPLIASVKTGNKKLTASLILLGANATLRDSAGYTASYYAMRAGDRELASQLMAEEERIRAEEYASVLARKRAAARKRAGSGGCFIRKADGSTVPCPVL